MTFRNTFFIASAGVLLGQFPRVSEAQDTVRTRSGTARGVRDGDLTVYRGIPYAAPPIGDLRWKPPRLAPRWDGVREATTFGPPCPQPPQPGARPLRWNEDCLTINVWTPAHGAGRSLPVLVVIPSGGFYAGGSQDALNDGAGLAKQGIVVVSFNYRLGVFGFFAHPALSKESSTGTSGNYGLLDQIAALQWVRDNIASFGGDARNVTITGTSAGGSSVLYLMTSPLARGLFARGIAESAALVYGPLGHRAERRYGRESRETQGVRLGADIAALRALSAEELLRRSETRTDLMFTDGPDYWPMVDGLVLPDEPWALLEAGRFTRIPLIIGTTTDDGSVFGLANSFKTRDAWREHLARRHPGAESVVEAAYRIVADTDFFPVGVRWVNDWYFHGSARAAARAIAAHGVPVFLFSFSRTPPIPPINGRNLGAAHTLTTQYAFGNYHPGLVSRLEDVDRTLARAIRDSWLKFARTGDPNVAGLPSWPRYDKTSDRHMDFGAEIRVGSGLHAVSLDGFDRAFAMMRSRRDSSTR